MPRGVALTAEYERVARIPRREWPYKLTEQDVSDVSQLLRNPNRSVTLRAVQAAALLDLHDHVLAGGRGLLGPIAVGAGKALICCLAGAALSDTRPPVKSLVWLVPANLVAQSQHVATQAKQDWKINYAIHVVSYESLSSARNADVLDRLAPDVICCDEAHKLRGNSVRTKRFKRHLKERTDHGDPPVVLFLSGTITQRSLFDFSWMIYYIYGAPQCRPTTPIPLHYPILRDWDAALGVHRPGYTVPLAPGVLKNLATGNETPRQGFRRRLTETSGIVGTSESACDTALNIYQVHDTRAALANSGKSTGIRIPQNVLDAMQEVRKNGRTPFGLVFDDPLSESRYLRQLVLGYYLRWRWPNGGQPDQRWLDARANWALELRSLLATRGGPGADSPLLMTNAVKRGDVKAQYLEPWLKERARLGVGDLPLTQAEWISTYAVDAVLAQASDAGGLGDAGIVWYQGIAFGEALKRTQQIQVYAGGDDRALLQRATGPQAGKGWIACSIQAHGTGKNLQAWNTALIVSPPSSGQTFEQLIGRHHRPGQLADEVNLHLWQLTPEQRAALASAQKDAEYLQALQGPQKLLQATYG